MSGYPLILSNTILTDIPRPIANNQNLTGLMLRNLLLITSLMLLCAPTSAQLKVSLLKTENRVNPVGIDFTHPRFSWELLSEERNVLQTAYEIAVSDEKGGVWETGKVLSGTSVQIPYNGTTLQSGKKYTWKVRVWDNHGHQSAWTTGAYFQTGLFHPKEEITAKWITSGLAADTAYGKVPYFRKVFSADKKISSAVAYITARGLYEAEMNGQRIGDAYLTPGWTSYHHRLLYQTYDVTALLKKGANAIGVKVANGWYRGELGWDSRINTYGTETAVLVQLEIRYTDGSTATVISDGSWKTTTGPIISSEIYDGEVYDARLELQGWSAASFNDAAWEPVVVSTYANDNLFASTNELIRRKEILKPVKLLKTPKGEYVLDFGQNLVGWVEYNVSGAAGTTVRLSHAEVLDKDGNLYFENLRHAKAEDTYILKGGGEEQVTPHFTYHGFRFVRVEGLAAAPDISKFRAVALHADMEPSGNFECSDSLVNRLQQNVQWGQRGNFLDVPTDCPQRDERLGWMGDAQVFSTTAAFNFNVSNFFSKWLKDVVAEQAPNGAFPFYVPHFDYSEKNEGVGAAGWSDAGIIIPWNMYQTYGDVNVLKENYPAMKAYFNYMRSRSTNDLWNKGFQFGDWLSYREDDSRMATGSRSAITDNYLVAQCFYSYCATLLEKIATTLGHTDDAAEYAAMNEKIKVAFRREYMSASGRLISDAQTAYVLALHFDMLPVELRQQAVDRLVNNIKDYGYHLTTGFLGTPYLNNVLSRFGHADVAYRLLLQDTYPSWLYQVKMGATTVWERWDSQKPDGTFQNPGMTSFNHYAYGAIGEWLYRHVAGLQQDTAGYKKIVIHPEPGGGLTYAKATYHSIHGVITSSWKKDAGKTTYVFTIPANTTATVVLPVRGIEQVKEHNKPVNFKVTGKEGENLQFEVGSGTYQLEI
jgi:alpha-L-rhamnosidase